MKTIWVVPLARRDAAWRVKPFGQYLAEGNFVPAVEKEKVTELQARLPEAQAVVHYLYEDPFLEVIFAESNREESAFVGFWNERGFNA